MATHTTCDFCGETSGAGSLDSRTGYINITIGETIPHGYDNRAKKCFSFNDLHTKCRNEIENQIREIYNSCACRNRN